MGEVLDRKIAVVLDLIEQRFGTSFNRVLVVGCGGAAEVFAIADRFNCEVVGIDIDGCRFPSRVDSRVTLKVEDAANLPYRDGYFDMLYSFHALEHIEHLDAALGEMKRVLAPGGAAFLGAPNKSRAFGYIGSDASWRDKLAWNLDDWKARLAGRWENHLGAHAGFTRREMKRLAAVFGGVCDQTDSYYSRLYPNRTGILRALKITRLSTLIYPSLYVSN